MSSTIGSRIKAIRESAGVSEARLAEAVGVTQPTVSRWERGHVALRVFQLVKIASALRVDVAEIICPKPKRARP